MVSRGHSRRAWLLRGAALTLWQSAMHGQACPGWEMRLAARWAPPLLGRMLASLRRRRKDPHPHPPPPPSTRVFYARLHADLKERF